MSVLSSTILAPWDRAMQAVHRLIAWLDRQVVLPTDSPDQVLRKRAVGLVPLAAINNAFALFLAYNWLGLHWQSLLALGYIVLFAIGIAHFLRTKRPEPLMYIQLAGTIAVVFLAQWVIGGYVISGGITIYGITGPFAAVYMRARVRTVWFLAFVALSVISGFIDHWVSLHAVKIPGAWVSAFFVLNSVSLLCFIYVPIRYVMDQLILLKDAVEHERARSDALLLNILPRSIADRLKGGESVIADWYDDVTILLADIVNFTPLSARLPPRVVVGMLNDLFSAFDDLADRHGLEKIKTMGAVAGAPQPRADHADAALAMAREMLLVVARFGAERELPLDVRIGLHSGPVLAGVIGKCKFQYDVYGDTVNTASRMESHGVPGTIQVTDETYRRLDRRYVFEVREPIDVKGKGMMVTYLLVETSTGEPERATAGETRATRVTTS